MLKDIQKEQDIKLCKRCHRPLRGEKSKELGFGTVCYKKYMNRKRYYLFTMEVSNEATIKE